MSSHQNQNRFSDSAGVPWEGRSFDAGIYSGDDGSARPELIASIVDFRAGLVSIEKVVEEIRVSRLLIPLLAKLGDSDTGANGLVVDKSAELAIVSVKSPDNQDSLVVFSSVVAMNTWNKAARPVPADAIRIALAAASEMNTRVVLDPGSDSEFVLRRPAIAALAQNLDWTAPEKSSAVFRVIQDSLERESSVLDFRLSSGDPLSILAGAELRIEFELKPGLDPVELRSLLDRVSTKWSQSEDFAKMVDSVEIKLKHSSVL